MGGGGIRMCVLAGRPRIREPVARKTRFRSFDAAAACAIISCRRFPPVPPLAVTAPAWPAIWGFPGRFNLRFNAGRPLDLPAKPPYFERRSGSQPVPHGGAKAERATPERRRPTEPDPDNAGEGILNLPRSFLTGRTRMRVAGLFAVNAQPSIKYDRDQRITRAAQQRATARFQTHLCCGSTPCRCARADARDRGHADEVPHRRD